MMPPYGHPYAAMYPHGGVYTHPAVPIVSLLLIFVTGTKLVHILLKLIDTDKV
jgi:plant G-box-binding factor